LTISRIARSERPRPSDFCAWCSMISAKFRQSHKTTPPAAPRRSPRDPREGDREAPGP
jgi:hypothetical protein